MHVLQSLFTRADREWQKDGVIIRERNITNIKKLGTAPGSACFYIGNAFVSDRRGAYDW